MAQARDLKGSRRDIAVALSDDWRTANEVAKMLGKQTGSIFGVLRRMHADGLLTADSDPDPPTRGTQYRLTALGLEALREALADAGYVGQLAEGGRLLFVERRKGLLPASEVLASKVGAGLVEWAAELPSGWLLALVDGADAHRVHLLQGELEQAGCRWHDLHVDALVTGAMLRQRAESLHTRGAS
jgi:DNA-binding PadR family transcriptional regulator